MVNNIIDMQCVVIVAHFSVESQFAVSLSISGIIRFISDFYLCSTTGISLVVVCVQSRIQR